MDRKIGEFMQKRAEIVNTLISEVALFEPGEIVQLWNGGTIVGHGQIVQALFLKKQGLIAYRIKDEKGYIFTNLEFELKLEKGLYPPVFVRDFEHSTAFEDEGRSIVDEGLPLDIDKAGDNTESVL